MYIYALSFILSAIVVGTSISIFHSSRMKRLDKEASRLIKLLKSKHQCEAKLWAELFEVLLKAFPVKPGSVVRSRHSRILIRNLIKSEGQEIFKTFVSHGIGTNNQTFFDSLFGSPSYCHIRWVIDPLLKEGQGAVIDAKHEEYKKRIS